MDLLRRIQGPGWHGRGGIHTHMTNTRITDPEIIERRYPVVVKSFCLNPGTGGQGKYNGGDGIIRELMFCRLMTLSVLTERRVFSPYGLAGSLSQGEVNAIYRYNTVLNPNSLPSP